MRVLANTRGLIVVFLFGIIIGLGIGVMLPVQKNGAPTADDTTKKENQETAIKTENDTTTVVNQVRGENSLVVNSQPAGDKVIASMVALNTSGWVAVHELVGDDLGAILGAKRFDAGKYFGVSIPLLRGTQAQQNYMVVVHADDGDSEFDFKKEIPVQDASGEFITAQFFATPNVDDVDTGDTISE